jgi:DNA mismatch repair protein MutL
MDISNNYKKAINKLPLEVINFIAAGEIVERPSSIVKELVENSIDSGANIITVEAICESNGDIIIKIEDNGEGISVSDLSNVFKKHHTSKAWDLDSIVNIDTMGFRGEALWSIGNVSHITIITQEDNKAWEIDCKYGIVGSIREFSLPFQRGTSIIVKNIFNNIPARKKFLRSFSTEYQHIFSIVNQEAHCNPLVTFILKNNNKVLAHYSSVHNKYMRLKQILGDQWEENFTSSVSLEEYHCEGIISTKPGKILLSINGRPFWDFKITNFLKMEIRKKILSTTNISGGIWLTMPKDDLDLNVHPRKTEIKFKDTNSFYALLRLLVSQGNFQESLWLKENSYALKDSINVKTGEKLKLDPQFNSHKLLKSTMGFLGKSIAKENNPDNQNTGENNSFGGSNIILQIPHQENNREFIVKKIHDNYIIFLDVWKYRSHKFPKDSGDKIKYSSRMFVSKIISMGAENIGKLCKMSLQEYPIKFSVISGDSIIAWEIPKEYNHSVIEFFQELKSYLDGCSNPDILEFLCKVIPQEPQKVHQNNSDLATLWEIEQDIENLKPEDIEILRQEGVLFTWIL